MKPTDYHRHPYRKIALRSKLPGWFVVMLICWGTALQAQSPKHTNNWYFGNQAGVTFNGGTPQAVANGRLQTAEGCAARSDENGQLLIYSDGSTIWNRNHEVVTGATNLGGSRQSTQSVLIVPYQKSPAEFYVFSVGAATQQTGIQYSFVNTNQNGGSGALLLKNRPFAGPSAEKITTINYCNNLNHWIISHELGTNAFRVNLLNDNGVIATPTLYKVGSVHQQSKGYMKPSHDGRKLAVAVSDSAHGGFLEIFDFDNATGAISNPVKLQGPETDGAYGIEFSPDNTLIYLSSMFSKKIYQLRVSDLAITATLSVQAQSRYSPGIGALQIGPDNKIYGAQPREQYLLAINQPNQVGASCELVSQAVNLGGRTAMAGLPFNVDTLFKLPPKVNIALTNLGGCNNYLLSSKTQNLDPAYLSYQWYLNGVAIPGATSATLRPTQSGTYLMKVRETKCEDIHLTSTEELPIILVRVDPTATLIPDSCGAVRLNAHATGGTPVWTGPGILPSQYQLDSMTISAINGTQTYRVRVTSDKDASCFSEKDVTVTFSKPLPFQLASPAQTACGDTLTVRATPTADWNSFRWQLPDGALVVGAGFVARQSGVYSVTALSTSTGCTSITALTVTLNPIPALTLLRRQIDTCLVDAAYIEVDAGTFADASYRWEKEGVAVSSVPILKSNEYGSYVVTARTLAGCQARDSVRIRRNCPVTEPAAYVPDMFTPNQDGMNETLVIYSSAAERITLTIYSRWGEVLYRATSEGATVQPKWSTWDGTYQGQPVTNGVYSYQLDIKGLDYPNVFSRKGVIEVVR